MTYAEEGVGTVLAVTSAPALMSIFVPSSHPLITAQ